MNNLNLTGRVVKKPEMKTSANGKNYCFLTIAVQESKEIVHFFETSLFGKNAENAVTYLDSGDCIGINGSLSTYKGKDQKTRITINVYRLEFISKAHRKTQTSSTQGKMEGEN